MPERRFQESISSKDSVQENIEANKESLIISDIEHDREIKDFIADISRGFSLDVLLDILKEKTREMKSDILESPDVRSALAARLADVAARADFDLFDEFVGVFELQDFLDKEPVKKALCDGLIKSMRWPSGSLVYLANLVLSHEYLGGVLRDPRVRQVVESRAVFILQNGFFGGVTDCLTDLHAVDILQEKPYQEAASEGVRAWFARETLTAELIRELRDNPFLYEILEDEQAQSVVSSRFITLLEGDILGYGGASEFLRAFNRGGLLGRPEVVSAIESRISGLFEQGLFSEGNDFLQALDAVHLLNKKPLQDAIVNGLVRFLGENVDPWDILQLLKRNLFLEVGFKNSKVQRIIASRLLDIFDSATPDSSEEVIKKVRKIVLELPVDGVLSSGEYQSAATSFLAKRLSPYVYGTDVSQFHSQVGELLHSLALPRSVLTTPEIQGYFQEYMKRVVALGHFQYVLYVIRDYQVEPDDGRSIIREMFLRDKSQEEIEEMAVHMRLSPRDFLELLPDTYQPAIATLRAKYPALIEQAQRSIDTVFVIFALGADIDIVLETLEKESFLAEALTQNPRFGSKLVLKFPSFDEVAQDKIRTLFGCKKTVSESDPDIDPKSSAFRLGVQDQLLPLWRNQEILEIMKKQGVDTEVWLTYDETEDFILGGKDVTPLCERIATPVGRLGQAVGTFGYHIKEALLSVRDDLKKIQVESKKSIQIKEEISVLSAKINEIKTSGDEARAARMEKGLAMMQKELVTMKPVDLWSQVVDELAGVLKMRDGLTLGGQKLADAEQKYNDAPSEKGFSPQSLVVLKDNFSKAREGFRSLVSKLERRLGSFRSGLPDLLQPLGAEKVVGVIKEIEARLAEQLIHINSDFGTLNSLFRDTQEQSGGKLEKLHMSISVWARNPDVDLYQGNYSPCCVCIDSAYHSETSPIADYTTDLGIQIVNITDEVKGEPVVAAWCWVGGSKKGTALVVDNIEANTLFSTAHPTELREKLFSYLIDYAKALGVDRLVLGKANNDIPTASELTKLPDDEFTYKKIGGCNGRDEYYLEAEDVSVKLLWEKAYKLKKEKQEKPRVERVVINDLASRLIVESDLRDILVMEDRVYGADGLVRGQEMTDEMMETNGLKYSVLLKGVPEGKQDPELLAYLVAHEDETYEGKPSVYLEDIAVGPEYQGSGLGWKLVEASLVSLKEEAQRQGKPILWDMHLRPASQRLFERHEQDLSNQGIYLKESDLVPEYYGEHEDALYQIYEVTP